MTVAPITVTIKDKDLTRWEQEIHLNRHLLKTLRDRGIPALGLLSLRGVETGSITIERIGDEHVFTWEPGHKRAPVILDDL